MKAWIFSDLHLPSTAASLLGGMAIPDADVCICAGNISEAGMAAGVRLLGRSLSARMPVIFVPGNCDYRARSRSIPEVMADARSEAELHRGLHILEQESLELNGILFVGATLWSDMNLFGDQRLAIDFASRSKDYTHIKASRKPRTRFTPRKSIGLHQNARLFIEDSLASSRHLPTVVVTHHAPSLQSVPSECFNDPLTPTVASSLDRLILEARPDLWVHGGVCEFRNYSLGATRVIANPRGWGPVRQFDDRLGSFIPDLVIDVCEDSKSMLSRGATKTADFGRTVDATV